MTLSTFRSRWSGGTKASTSTMTISFREFFLQFSILRPPFLYYTRKTSPPARFFDKLKRTGMRNHTGPFGASRPVSRVLSFKTAIYLDASLPAHSSRLHGTAGPACCPSTALLRIEFTATGASTPSGELLPHLSTLTGQRPADYFCCTFPRVAPGGGYPLSLPCGARTFLTDGPFAPSARLSSLLDWSIIQENGVYVKWFPGLETSKHMEPLTVSIEFFYPVC